MLNTQEKKKEPREHEMLNEQKRGKQKRFLKKAGKGRNLKKSNSIVDVVTNSALRSDSDLILVNG